MSPSAASDIRGMWAAMPLALHGDGSVDAGALAELVARYEAAGLPGAYCTGTDGEFHTLELDEFTQVIDAFAAAAERVGLPVEAGTGWVTQRGAIDRTRVARDRGITTVQVVPPFWVTVNDWERVRFYEALSAAVPDVSILVYSTERIGRVLDAAQMRAIADAVPAVIGSKYDGWDPAEFAAICAATPGLVHLPVDVGIGPSSAYPSLALCSWFYPDATTNVAALGTHVHSDDDADVVLGNSWFSPISEGIIAYDELTTPSYTFTICRNAGCT